VGDGVFDHWFMRNKFLFAKFLFVMNGKEQKTLAVLRRKWKGWETI